jgi:ribosome-associated translation inhibitor RaiA
MRHEIRYKNSHRSEAAEIYARKRVNLALDRFVERIDVLSIKFEDLNGPKGGVDKRCTIEARGRLLPRIASAHAENYFVAADRAFQKLERSLARACERESHHAGALFRRVA